MTAAERQKLIDQYKDGYRAVAEALIGATDEELDLRPAPGKWSAREVVHHLADSETTSYLRLRALPLTPETSEFVSAHDRVYVIDQNRDGQMYDVLRLEIAEPTKLRSIRHYDGFPLDAETVLEGIEAGEKK